MNRHARILIGATAAAVALGAVLYMYGPNELREVPVQGGVGALGADAGETVAFSVLAEGAHAADMESRKNVAVYSADEFERLWRMAFGDRSGMPEVDFDTQYVVGVFAGTKPSGGYGIRVERVVDGNGVRTVEMVITKPGPGCQVTQALTSPFQIIVLPFSDRQLARAEEEVEALCL